MNVYTLDNWEKIMRLTQEQRAPRRVTDQFCKEESSVVRCMGGSCEANGDKDE